MELSITYIALNLICLPDMALKEHPERQIQQIKNSIREFGFNDPIAIDEENEIIEGVGRYLAAKELELGAIPVIHLLHLSQAQKTAYRIAHNKITLNSGFNLEALRSEFESLSQLDSSLLSLTAFETMEIKDLLTLPTFQEVPELTESLSETKTVTCPSCGGTVYV